MRAPARNGTRASTTLRDSVWPRISRGRCDAPPRRRVLRRRRPPIRADKRPLARTRTRTRRAGTKQSLGTLTRISGPESPIVWQSCSLTVSHVAQARYSAARNNFLQFRHLWDYFQDARLMERRTRWSIGNRQWTIDSDIYEYTRHKISRQNHSIFSVFKSLYHYRSRILFPINHNHTRVSELLDRRL